MTYADTALLMAFTAAALAVLGWALWCYLNDPYK